MISKEFLKRALFNTKKLLSFACPTCNNGNIRLSSDKLIKRITSDKKSGMLRFIAIPECDSCGECVTISGDASFYNELNYRTSSEYNGSKYLAFTPTYFNPPLNIFVVSSHCPENIKYCVLKGFSHYWNDIASTANRIRTCVELILDEQGVTKVGTLHSRLESYKKSNHDLGSKLMAVKWIGNIGSHESVLAQEDILNGFELLEFVIDELYERPNKTNRLNNLSENINKNKGLSNSH
jgi:hypothetical protein